MYQEAIYPLMLTISQLNSAEKKPEIEKPLSNHKSRQL